MGRKKIRSTDIGPINVLQLENIKIFLCHSAKPLWVSHFRQPITLSDLNWKLTFFGIKHRSSLFYGSMIQYK